MILAQNFIGLFFTKGPLSSLIFVEIMRPLVEIFKVKLWSPMARKLVDRFFSKFVN